MYKSNNQEMLLEIFAKNKDKTFTGVELTEILKDKMNKATIYRQLIKLEELNKIIKFYNKQEDIYEYQLYQGCNKHLHLKCIKCGKIVHLKCDETDAFLSHIKNHHGFSVDKTQTVIYGLCKECQQC